MNHSFNVEIAEKFGLEEAIILENIYFRKKNTQLMKTGLYNSALYNLPALCYACLIFNYETIGKHTKNGRY